MKLPFRSRDRRASGRDLPVPEAGGDAVPGTPGGPTHHGGRLHVGAGRERFEGWVNLDVQALPGVDVVADVTAGLNFRDMELVYAEHFLEHLRIDHALDFLVDCHRALADGGWLRLSTPNLDWVWRTHYDLDAADEVRAGQAVITNRAFHGWRHQFLWNRPLLGRALAACGFPDVSWCRYGESGHPELTGLERHDTYEDDEALPHVLIAEAPRGAADPRAQAALRAEIERDFLSQLAD